MENSLEKGKSMPIGTITNGFKKIAEGKWRKVSEHGKTKEEHEKMRDSSEENRVNAFNSNKPHKLYEESYNKHDEAASKLDSKEYSDVDVVGKEKEDDYTKTKKEIIKKLEDKVEELNNSTANLQNEQSLKKTKAILSVHKSELEEHEKDKKIKKSTTNDIEKALVTLEIGYLAGQVSEEQIKEARELVKAERAGHKYFKREANGKGGWKYYYTEAQYKKEKGGEEKKSEDTSIDKDSIIKHFKDKNIKVVFDDSDDGRFKVLPLTKANADSYDVDYALHRSQNFIGVELKNDKLHFESYSGYGHTDIKRLLKDKLTDTEVGNKNTQKRKLGSGNGPVITLKDLEKLTSFMEEERAKESKRQRA